MLNQKLLLIFAVSVSCGSLPFSNTTFLYRTSWQLHLTVAKYDAMTLYREFVTLSIVVDWQIAQLRQQLEEQRAENKELKASMASTQNELRRLILEKSDDGKQQQASTVSSVNENISTSEQNNSEADTLLVAEVDSPLVTSQIPNRDRSSHIGENDDQESVYFAHEDGALFPASATDADDVISLRSDAGGARPKVGTSRSESYPKSAEVEINRLKLELAMTRAKLKHATTHHGISRSSFCSKY